MTQEEIIRMAREAGIIFEPMTIDGIEYEYRYVRCSDSIGEDEADCIERFAALVAAHEREKLAEQEPVAEGYMKCPACNDRGVIRQHFTELERVLIEDAFEKAVKNASPQKQAVQKPVAWMHKATVEWIKQPRNERNQTQVIVTGVNVFDGQVPLYAAPARTKDLTDDEVAHAYMECAGGDIIARCHAVIAAYKEKNK